MSKTINRPLLGIGWHWLWFGPLCVLVLLLVERHTVVFSLAVLPLLWQRWSWGVLISPSAAFCLSVIVFSVTFPLYGLGAVGVLVSTRQRWVWVFVPLTIAAILFCPLLTDLLIWGSFPLTYDSEGVARLRMIPFIPWPSGDYGEF